MSQANQGQEQAVRRNDRRGWMFTAGSFTAVALILALTPGVVNLSAWRACTRTSTWRRWRMPRFWSSCT